MCEPFLSSPVRIVARFSVNMQWLNLITGSPVWSSRCPLIHAAAQLVKGPIAVLLVQGRNGLVCCSICSLSPVLLLSHGLQNSIAFCIIEIISLFYF